MPRLEVNKIRRVTRVSTPEGTTSIGRSSKNDIVLPHSTVSRRHCVIEVMDGVAKLRDLGSSYGTKLNGEKVTEAVVREGDLIAIGPFEISFADPHASGSFAAIPDDSHASASGDASALDLADTEALETLRVELARARAESQAEHQHAETLESELSRHRGELESSREELAAARGAIQARDEEIATMRDRIEALENERRTLTTQLGEETTTHERGRDVLQQRLDEAATRIGDLETQLARETRDREELTHRLEDSLANVEEIRQDAKRAGRDLDARNKSLQKTSSRAASLQTRVEQLEVTLRDARERMERAEGALGHFEPAIQQLRESSQRLSAVQRSLRALEALWIETNDWVEESEERAPELLEQATHQRDSVGTQLEAAHLERDAAIEELQATVAQFVPASPVQPVRRRAVAAPQGWLAKKVRKRA